MALFSFDAETAKAMRETADRYVSELVKRFIEGEPPAYLPIPVEGPAEAYSWMSSGAPKLREWVGDQRAQEMHFTPQGGAAHGMVLPESHRIEVLDGPNCCCAAEPIEAHSIMGGIRVHYIGHWHPSVLGHCGTCVTPSRDSEEIKVIYGEDLAAPWKTVTAARKDFEICTCGTRKQTYDLKLAQPYSPIRDYIKTCNFGYRGADYGAQPSRSELRVWAQAHALPPSFDFGFTQTGRMSSRPNLSNIPRSVGIHSGRNQGKTAALRAAMLSAQPGIYTFAGLLDPVVGAPARMKGVEPIGVVTRVLENGCAEVVIGGGAPTDYVALGHEVHRRISAYYDEPKEPRETYAEWSARMDRESAERRKVDEMAEAKGVELHMAVRSESAGHNTMRSVYPNERERAEHFDQLFRAIGREYPAGAGLSPDEKLQVLALEVPRYIVRLEELRKQAADRAVTTTQQERADAIAYIRSKFRGVPPLEEVLRAIEAGDHVGYHAHAAQLEAAEPKRPDGSKLPKGEMHHGFEDGSSYPAASRATFSVPPSGEPTVCYGGGYYREGADGDPVWVPTPNALELRR